jgi:hypothetical protein
VAGIEPSRLLSFTMRELMMFSKGLRQRKAQEENIIRKFAYIFYSANRDPKKAVIPQNRFWPIPEIDSYNHSFDIANQNNDIKAKLLKAWRLSEN